MTVIIALVIFVLILGGIVVVHELGHLLTAKWRGVKVEEFGIGFPPRLLSFKKGETEYSLNLIPLGGFCKMVGEQDSEAERGLQSKGYGSRVLVLAAGSIMNLLLPFLLVIIAFAVPHEVGQGVKIASVLDDSAASRAELQADDILLEANGQELVHTVDFSEILNATPDAPLVLLIERGGEELLITIALPYSIENGVSKAGVGLVPATAVKESLIGWRGITTGVRATADMYVAFGGMLADLFTGGADFGSVVGPIGVADATAEIVPLGASVVLLWAASISMAIGVANLLPIPVFDGGHILFVLIEMARRGKRVSLKVRTIAQMVGLAVIMTLFLVVGFNDLVRLLSGGSLFP